MVVIVLCCQMMGKTSLIPGVRYETIEARSILTATGGYLEGCTHSLNPYLGCAFGRGSCPYCYVRALPIQRFARAPWGEWVKAKVNAPELLTAELASLRRGGAFGSLRIFMGSSTDPYQGAEARLGLSRRLLSVFDDSGDFGLLVIQTRSPLIERDTDLLKQLGCRVLVSLTIETNRESVRRLITPTSPSIARRLATLEHLGRAGIRTQAALSPLLPCDPPILADMVASRTSRVVVDTLSHGDGAQGRRSRSLGMPALFAAIDEPEWFDSDTYLEVLQLLRARMGSGNVGFSSAGFSPA